MARDLPPAYRQEHVGGRGVVIPWPVPWSGRRMRARITAPAIPVGRPADGQVLATRLTRRRTASRQPGKGSSREGRRRSSACTPARPVGQHTAIIVTSCLDTGESVEGAGISSGVAGCFLGAAGGVARLVGVCAGPGQAAAVDDQVVLADRSVLEPAFQHLAGAGGVARLGRQ